MQNRSRHGHTENTAHSTHTTQPVNKHTQEETHLCVRTKTHTHRHRHTHTHTPAFSSSPGAVWCSKLISPERLSHDALTLQIKTRRPGHRSTEGNYLLSAHQRHLTHTHTHTHTGTRARKHTRTHTHTHAHTRTRTSGGGRTQGSCYQRP